MHTQDMQGNFPAWDHAYSLLPTDELIQNAREKWQDIRDEVGFNASTLELDTILTSVFSRLTAYNEVAVGATTRTRV